MVDADDLTIYTTGDLAVDDQLCVDDTECAGSFGDRQGWNDPENVTPSTLQVYGTSTFQLTMDGGSYLEEVVYAPAGENGTSDATLDGNAIVDGSVVVGSVEASGTPSIYSSSSSRSIRTLARHRVA